ncbi:kinase-like domain-containing protein [Mycena leptocephala]|nr:kinase-like domain-containing protein [Mycena leptocephala]
MDLKHCPLNLILYTRSILHRRSDRRLNEFQDLVKSWQEWDLLTGLANYYTIVDILFSFLKGDSGPDRNGISPTEIFEKISQDASAISTQIITVLSSGPESYKQFWPVVDLLHKNFSRPLLSEALIRLSRAAKLQPRCLPLSGVETIGIQVAAGAFGDIWQGRVQGQSVCIKMMRVFRDTDIQDVLKAFGREALIWRQLSHPNLLPFFGLYYMDSRLCLVFTMDGISDVAMGLRYLHTEHIVHGDLKGTNILITPSGRACITDFGLSTISDAVSERFTHSTSSVQGGTARYQAPEVLSAEMPNHYGSDVYAFAAADWDERSTSRFRRGLQDRSLVPSITEIERRVFEDSSPTHIEEPTSTKAALSLVPSITEIERRVFGEHCWSSLPVRKLSVPVGGLQLVCGLRRKLVYTARPGAYILQVSAPGLVAGGIALCFPSKDIQAVPETSAGNGPSHLPI